MTEGPWRHPGKNVQADGTVKGVAGSMAEENAVRRWQGKTARERAATAVEPRVLLCSQGPLGPSEPGQGSGDKGKVPSPSGHYCTHLGNRKLGVSTRSQNERRQEVAGSGWLWVGLSTGTLGLSVPSVPQGGLWGLRQSPWVHCLPSTPVSSSHFPLEKVPFLLSAPGSVSLAPGTPAVALPPLHCWTRIDDDRPEGLKPCFHCKHWNGALSFHGRVKLG